VRAGGDLAPGGQGANAIALPEPGPTVGVGSVAVPASAAAAVGDGARAPERARPTAPRRARACGANTQEKTEISEIDAPPISRELKKRWSYFIRKVYETDPLICPKCCGQMRIISFIDQADVIKKILQHLGLWEESHAPPESEPPRKEIKEITFDPSYGSINSPSRGRSRDSQLI